MDGVPLGSTREHYALEEKDKNGQVLPRSYKCSQNPILFMFFVMVLLNRTLPMKLESSLQTRSSR